MADGASSTDYRSRGGSTVHLRPAVALVSSAALLAVAVPSAQMVGDRVK
jgi:hypothetical protein